MKKRSLLLLLALALVLPPSLNAQFGALKKSLNKAINKELGKKVDTAIDKSLKDANKANNQDKEEQSGKDPGQENSGTLGSGRGLFGGKIDIKYKEEYQFTGRIFMQMETYDKKEAIKSDYYTYFNSNTLNAGIEVNTQDPKGGEAKLPSIFLFDGENKCFMMLINGNNSKTGIISTLPSDSAIAAQAKSQRGEAPKQPVITKTGNTRMIAGYKCEEYKIEEEGKDGYSLVWMTKDVKLKAENKYWSKAGMPSYYGYPGFEGAMMLAMEAYDKKNQPAMKMETKEINENYSHSISTAGYTFMKMNFGQVGKK